jgi:competence protein ComEA
MTLGRYLGAIGFCLLITMPVAAQTPSASKPPTAASQPAGALVDINSASAEELDKLPGIGPARAKAIIANRPYGGKDDLANRKIIPPNVYNQIKDKIIARQK